MPPRDAVVAVALLVIGAVISVLRIPASLLNGLYAEDGEVFIWDWLWRPRWSLFFAPYAGYLHVLPRILSGLTVLLPVAWWGVATTVLACLTIGGVSAGVWLAARALELGRVVAAAVALVPVLAPMAAVEALGNLCNLHWYCLYLLTWVCCAGRRLTHPFVWAVVVLLSCLTEIQALILLPFVAITWWRRRVAWPIVAAWLIGTASQLLCYVTALRPRAPGHPSILGTVAGYLGNVVLGGFGERATLSRTLSLVRLGFAGLLFVAFVALAITVLWRSSQRWLGLFLLALSGALWVVAMWSNNSLDFDRMLVLFRWGTTASMVFTAGVAIVLSEVRWRSWIRISVAVVLVLLILRGFYADNSVRQGRAPDWPVALEASSGTCTTTSRTTDVTIWPDGWFVRLSCARVR